MREWSSLCSRLKLTVSLRAALNNRIGNETRPNVRWPLHTLAAITTPLYAKTIRHGYVHFRTGRCDAANPKPVRITMENTFARPTPAGRAACVDPMVALR